MRFLDHFRRGPPPQQQTAPPLHLPGLPAIPRISEQPLYLSNGRRVHISPPRRLSRGRDRAEGSSVNTPPVASSTSEPNPLLEPLPLDHPVPPTPHDTQLEPGPSSTHLQFPGFLSAPDWNRRYAFHETDLNLDPGSQPPLLPPPHQARVGVDRNLAPSLNPDDHLGSPSNLHHQPPRTPRTLSRQAHSFVPSLPSPVSSRSAGPSRPRQLLLDDDIHIAHTRSTPEHEGPEPNPVPPIPVSMNPTFARQLRSWNEQRRRVASDIESGHLHPLAPPPPLDPESPTHHPFAAAAHLVPAVVDGDLGSDRPSHRSRVLATLGDDRDAYVFATSPTGRHVKIRAWILRQYPDFTPMGVQDFIEVLFANAADSRDSNVDRVLVSRIPRGSFAEAVQWILYSNELLESVLDVIEAAEVRDQGEADDVFVHYKRGAYWAPLRAVREAWPSLPLSQERISVLLGMGPEGPRIPAKYWASATYLVVAEGLARLWGDSPVSDVMRMTENLRDRLEEQGVNVGRVPSDMDGADGDDRAMLTQHLGDQAINWNRNTCVASLTSIALWHEPWGIAIIREQLHDVASSGKQLNDVPSSGNSPAPGDGDAPGENLQPVPVPVPNLGLASPPAV